MKHANTKAVVLPVDEPFLDALVARCDSLTTLIWGWQGQSRPMAGPRRILDQDQAHLPFLFSTIGKEAKKVTYAAICALLLHRDETSGRVADWLDKHRVERFAGIEHRSDAASLYVVTACERLHPAVPYAGLTLASTDRPLSSSMRRGYAVVYLPASFQSWFEDACRKWDALSGELPEVNLQTGQV